MEMEGGSLGARRNMASLDRKLERVLAYRASEELKEEDCCTVVSPAAESGADGPLECDREQKPKARNGAFQGQAELNSSSTLSSQMCSDADSLPTSSEAVCSSGVSTVTVDLVDKSRGKQVLQEGAPPHEHAIVGEENAAVKQAESADTAWTNDRHSSYLNSIEALFVRNMYDNDFGGLDVYGSPHGVEHSEHDCVESRAADCTSNPSELFELWQNGCLQAYYRPHVLELPAPTAPAVLHSPWVRHFKPKAGMSSAACAAHASEADQEESVPAVVEENTPVDEVGTSSGGVPDDVEIPGEEDGLLNWHARLQRQALKSKDSLQRKGSVNQGKRWSSEPEKSIVDSTRSKRQKCQQELAFIDLEMEEQFSLGRLKADAGDHAAGSNEQRAKDEPELVEQHPPVFMSCGTSDSIMLAEPEMLQRRSFRRILSSNNVCMKRDISMPVLDVDQVVPLLGTLGAEDICERVRVPDITNCQPELAALDRRNFKQGLSPLRRKSKSVSEQGKCEAPKVLRDSPKGTAAAAFKVGTEAQEEAGCTNLRYEVDTNPRKRSSSKTWTWGLQGLRRPVQERQPGDAAE